MNNFVFADFHEVRKAQKTTVGRYFGLDGATAQFQTELEIVSIELSRAHTDVDGFSFAANSVHGRVTQNCGQQTIIG